MNDKEKMQVIAKWVIGIVAVCILIYLGVRHVGNIGNAIVWFADLTKPLIIGIILALILNVPMSFIEQHLLQKLKKQKWKRPLAITLALLLVIGLFAGIAVLVVPELVEAVKLIIQIATGSLDQLAALNNSAKQLKSVENFFSEINVDWLSVKDKLESWVLRQKDHVMDYAVELAGSAFGMIVTGFISLVFSIYILAQKENLKRQVCRFIKVWLPEKTGTTLKHVFAVSGRTFRLFIAGQAIEAVILGVLCTIGMLILRIPYAPMVGALIGVTALVPLVGAYVGTIVGAIIILTENPFKAFIFVIFIIILQQVEGNVIYPRTVGAKIKLPALWVLAAVVVGGNLAGPLGMLLGVPATSAAFSIIKEATDNREKAAGMNTCVKGKKLP